MSRSADKWALAKGKKIQKKKGYVIADLALHWLDRHRKTVNKASSNVSEAHHYQESRWIETAYSNIPYCQGEERAEVTKASGKLS